MDTNKELLKIQRDQKIINNYFALFEKLKDAPNIEEEVKIINKIEIKLNAAISASRIISNSINKLVKVKIPETTTDDEVAAKIKSLINNRGAACQLSSAKNIIDRYSKSSSKSSKDLRSAIRHGIGTSGSRLLGIASDIKPILDNYFSIENNAHGYVFGIPSYPTKAEYFDGWQVTHLIDGNNAVNRCTITDREKFITSVNNGSIKIGRMIKASRSISTGDTVTWESRTFIIQSIVFSNDNKNNYSLVVRDHEKDVKCVIPYMISNDSSIPLSKLR